MGQTPQHSEKVRGNSEIKVPGRLLLNILFSPPPAGWQGSEKTTEGRYIRRNYSAVLLQKVTSMYPVFLICPKGMG